MSGLGGQTVIFGSFTESGTPDGLGMMTETSVEVAVSGCLFRTLRAEETSEGITDINTQVWRCTAPATDVTLAASSTGYLKYGGNIYQIIGGPQQFADLGGDIDHVVVWAQKQTG